MRRGRVAVIAVVVAAAAVTATMTATAGTGGNRPFGSNLVGRQADGSVLTSNNQYVSPAGAVIEQDGRPTATAVSPDGRTAVTLTAKTAQVLTVIDLASRKVVQTYTPASAAGDVSNGGLLYSPDGRTLWAAQTRDLLRFPVNPDGTVGTPAVLPLPGAPGLAPTGGPDNAPLPDGLAYSPDGNRLLVSLNGNNTLGVIDVATGSLLRQIPVGNAPSDVAVIGGHAYVANQGGRPALLSDFTNQSYGTPIVASPVNGRAVTGTVSEVDLTSGALVASYRVGLEPSALLVHGTDLLVANTNDDSVTVIDTARHRLGRTFTVNPLPAAPYGMQPDALAMLPDGHLAVSLGRANAIALYRYAGADHQVAFDGLIPTDWFPASVVYDAPLHQLVIGNTKGVGSLGTPYTVNEGPGTKPATSHGVYANVGSVQEVSTELTPQRMQRYTATVFADNQWNGLAARNARGSAGARPVAVPVHLGQPSKIKHVFLIVKENRTYDQVLGDLGRGNGDPSLTQFGAQVTPNEHALATTFPDLDNVYSDGSQSSDGHNWLTQAFVNSYLEKEYGNFDRSYPASGADALAYARSGFIWDDARRHGVSTESWGEYAQYFQGPRGEQPQGSWQQWYQDSQVMEGRATGPLHVPVGTYTAQTDVPSLAKILEPDYPNFQLQIPDQYRVDIFTRDFNRLLAQHRVPALNLLWLSSDHTAAVQPDFPTPRAEVADNDLATGRLVDLISHSSLWASSAVFILEDDSQNGVDHVDGHRNTVFIASPYARRGAVVSDYYTQLNVMRTIEQILGLPPMNQLDLAAEPMYHAFTDTADLRPFTVLPNRIRLDEYPSTVNQSPIAKAWTDWARQQDFRTEDMVPMEQLNRAIWYSTSNYGKPYPGDARVLLPSQVPGAPAAKATGSNGNAGNAGNADG